MSQEWLKLELDKLCGTSGCRCNKKPHYLSVTATKEINNPTRGYDKHIHTLSKGGTFTLYNVKYNEELIFSDGLDNVFGVTEVSVYYGGEKRDIPFIIEINNGGKQYYFNENPSSTGSRNTVWTRKNDLNKLDNLKEKLEELSCKSSNSAALDILKHKNRDYYCDNKVNVSGHKLKGANDMYEFKQTSQNNQPFKVHSIQYNGTEIPIPIPPEGVKEISTFYWKHHLGKPLVVKVLDTRNQPTYYFNDGRVGLQWDKRDKDKIGELNNAIVEHNCLRNRTTTIDISNRDNGKKYCCTKDCENRRIKVTENNLDDVFPGFTNYEHSSDDKLPFTIGRIMKGGEKQKGILFPIKNAYSVSVYYATSCKEQPIFLEILYAKDGYREYKWYQRITQNGWDLLDIPENEDQINKDLRENFRKVAKLLSENKCNPNSLPEDSTKSFREYPEPNGKLTSPDKVFEDLKKHISNTEFTPPMGLKEEEEEDQARKQANLEGKKYVFTLQKLDKLKMKPGKTPPNTKKLMQIAVKIVNEVKQELPALVPPPLTPIPAASTAHSSGVIIDIQKSPSNGKGHDTYTFGISDQKVKLVKSVDPPGSGFVKLTHTKNDSGIGPFTVEKVIFGEENNDTTAGLKLNSGNSIKHLAVWYWKEKGGIENPLLVEIIESNNNYKYHANKGGWNQWYPHGESQLQGEELEQKLDDLNCNLNKAVTMDITEISIRNRSHSCGNKIEVSSQSITLISNSIVSTNTSSIKYSIHKIQDKGYKLAKIKYYLQGQLNERKRIKADELKFPIEGPVDIYTFYCENNPILIYVDAFGQKKWYKRQNKNNHDSNWVVAGELDGVLPEKIKNRDCENWEKLKGVYTGLNCTIGDCSIIPGSKFSSGSTTIKFTSLPPPQVIIKLSENKNAIGGETTYIAPTETPSVTIRVTETTYPPNSDFLRYEHKDSNGGTQFTLAEIKDDNGEKVDVSELPKDVKNLSAYYWKYNTDNALLVGIFMDSGTTQYYRNSNKGNWTKHNIKSDGKPTEDELDLLNCEINDVVQIDVAQITDYCHNDKDSEINHNPVYKRKIRVLKAGDNLGNYVAYAHTPNSDAYTGEKSPHKLNISGFTNGKTPLTLSGLHLPVMGVQKIIIYFCKSEVRAGSTAENPLLIYLPNSDQGAHWFKKHDSGTIWEPVYKLNGKKCFDNAVVDFLDTLKSDCKPPSVTINIYSRLTGGTRYYNETGWITVENSLNSNIDGFTEHIHKAYGREGNYFTVEKFQYKSEEIKGDLNGIMKHVTHVSVFYWTPLEAHAKQGNQRGRPLLVKVTRNSYGLLETNYYENISTSHDDNTQWREWSLPRSKDALENKLELLNCDLNQVVSIDVNKTKGSYCGHRHNVHKKVSVSQVPDPSSKFGRYKAFQHIPNLKAYTGNSGSTHTFHISEFTSGQDKALTGLPTPLLDVSSITVYFCGKDTRSDRGIAQNPLLIYIPEAAGGKRWFQSEDKGKTWKPVGSETPKNEKEYSKIVEILDGLKSACAPPSVTIDIYHRDLGGHTKYYKYDSGSKRKILVMYVRDNSPGFTEYRHAIAGGIPFSVKEFQYNKQPITEGLKGPMYRVTTVSVFYWTALETDYNWSNKSRPLLVKITTQTPGGDLKEVYYENKGYKGNLNWTRNSVDSDTLRKKLHLLNCSLNNAVVIDISQKGNYDTCNDTDKLTLDPHGNDKMKVAKDHTDGLREKLGSYETYTHKLKDDPDGKFHIVNFKNGETTLTGIGYLPILDVDEVKVYFCKKNPDKPLLLYYHTPGRVPEHHLYKNNGLSSGAGIWESIGLLNTDYTTKVDKIQEVLDELGSECSPQSTPATPGSPQALSPVTGKATVPAPPHTEPPVATVPAITIGSVFSGTLTGAGGLTGLGWWAFKRSRGDPWVRQI